MKSSLIAHKERHPSFSQTMYGSSVHYVYIYVVAYMNGVFAVYVYIYVHVFKFHSRLNKFVNNIIHECKLHCFTTTSTYNVSENNEDTKHSRISRPSVTATVVFQNLRL